MLPEDVERLVVLLDDVERLVVLDEDDLEDDVVDELVVGKTLRAGVSVLDAEEG